MSFSGLWEIVSSSDFDDKYLHEEVAPYLTLKQAGKRVTGNYHVGLQQGSIDGRLQSVEQVFFSFEGMGSWDLLQRGGAAPALTLSGLPSAVIWEQGDVVIRINVSYRVLEQAVAEVVAAPLASLELSLAQPQLDVVTSERQLRDYTQAFRQMMDQVHELLPRATCIHVFYAGPPSLAFCCGQQISKTIHPRIVVYNYFGKDVPRYSWGLEITQDCDAEGFVVHPVAY